MSKRKRKKKGIFDLFDIGEEDSLLAREPTRGASGYSISVTYDNSGTPLVKVKTHGDVDVTELRKDITQRYPRARIEGLEKKLLIRVVDEEEGAKKEKSQAEEKTE